MLFRVVSEMVFLGVGEKNTSLQRLFKLEALKFLPAASPKA